jgi:phage tail protein X
MTTFYRCRDGDVLDAVCFDFYGTLESHVVEQVLAANIGLAGRGVFLPAGLQIVLPDIDLTSDDGVKLWD